MTNKKYILDSVLPVGKNGESVTTKANEATKENQLKTVDGSAKGNQSETGNFTLFTFY